MNDMSSTIVAKSDQINAADLIGSPRTITIKEVRIKAGEDQPVSVLIEGDSKSFRPCKGVRRLMVRVWGADASKYVGQSMTLFCDPSVTWAGKEEGGIRPSHMSGLDEPIIEFMRTSRAATKPYKILPLKAAAPRADKVADGVAALLKRIGDGEDIDDDAAVFKQRKWLETNRPELFAEIEAALGARAGDPFAEGPDDSQRGELPKPLTEYMLEMDAAENIDALGTAFDAAVADYPEERDALTRLRTAKIETFKATPK